MFDITPMLNQAFASVKNAISKKSIRDSYASRHARKSTDTEAGREHERLVQIFSDDPKGSDETLDEYVNRIFYKVN